MTGKNQQVSISHKCHTICRTLKTEFEWRVDGIRSLMKQPAKFKIESSEFSDLKGNPWQIDLYPKGQSGGKTSDNHIGIYVVSKFKRTDANIWANSVTVQYELQVYAGNHTEGTLLKSREASKKFEGVQQSWGWSNFVSHEELLGHLKASGEDVILVHCSLTMLDVQKVETVEPLPEVKNNLVEKLCQKCCIM